MASRRIGRLAAAALAISHLVAAQDPGTDTAEVHPTLSTWECTTSGGCVQQDTAVVLDWNYRYIHVINGSASCLTSSGGINSTLCPNEATCAANCVVEGANYTAAGVSTSGDTLTMYQYVESDGTYENASPRLYLLDSSTGDYVAMQLNGRELTFTVDVSNLPCGENAALYLSQMDSTGGRNEYNTGGANYGSGYCDAQCPVENWKNGTLNTADSGYCCTEMDILESNEEASAFTPHPCENGGCDADGCGYNAYAQGYTNYWAPGGTLDTSKPFTITTQFITSDGTTTGTLTTIKRQYIQNGVIVPPARTGGDNITEAWCTSNDGAAATYGGLPTIGTALTSGMTLVFSIWNDNSQYMNWLDSGGAGPCSSSAGNPATIKADDPTTHVIFSDIRWGDIGSTYSDVLSSSGSTTTKSSTSSTTTSTTTGKTTTTSTTMTTTSKATTTTTTAGSGAEQSHWGQCGGSYYTGPTSCSSPYACSTQNPYYAQCL